VRSRRHALQPDSARWHHWGCCRLVGSFLKCRIYVSVSHQENSMQFTTRGTSTSDAFLGGWLVEAGLRFILASLRVGALT
jgi:hypothetical protein